jgi:chromatin segregation and condensation protein Rec8/ScpA/Scc1 (kleisin family)
MTLRTDNDLTTENSGVRIPRGKPKTYTTDEEAKQKKKEYNRQYLKDNKEKYKEVQKKWREDNKEKVKLYAEKNKEKSKEKSENSKEDLKEYMREYNRKYYQENKEKILEKKKDENYLKVSRREKVCKICNGIYKNNQVTLHNKTKFHQKALNLVSAEKNEVLP